MISGIIEAVSTTGYIGVFLLTAIENIFPPIPSEIILPLIGKSVAEGNINFFLAVLAATLGGLVGTSFWYIIGWYMPAIMLEKFLRKYGGYIAITGKDFHKATKFFEKAITLDNSMIVARREISILNSMAQQKGDMFNRDLKDIVGSFFKRK